MTFWNKFIKIELIFFIPTEQKTCYRYDSVKFHDRLTNYVSFLHVITWQNSQLFWRDWLTKFVIFCATDWQKLQFFATIDWWNLQFFVQLNDNFMFFAAIDWKKSWLSSMIDWQISWLFAVNDWQNWQFFSTAKWRNSWFFAASYKRISRFFF